MAMVGRLINQDGISAKYAAIQLIPTVYVCVSQPQQRELMTAYSKTAQEEAPQIRKQAAIVLNEMIKLIPRVPETELLNMFNIFYLDE